MACISKIISSFDYECSSGATGILEALLIEKADIASFAYSSASGEISSVVLNSSGAVRLIDTPKRVLVLNTALKVNEGAPNAFTHSGTLTITALAPRNSATTSFLATEIINPMANSSLVIIAKTPGLLGMYLYRIYGLYYGMSVTGIDQSTHDNGGWYTVSFSTPENVIGEDTTMLQGEEYTRLRGLAV